MQRLLYIAIGLVFLAIIGLAFLRVTSSGSYVARSKLMRIQPGMGRDEVIRILGHPSQTQFHKRDYWIDGWKHGEHTLSVYFLTGQDPEDIDPTKLRVYAALAFAADEDETLLDDGLDLLGYPRHTGGLLLF